MLMIPIKRATPEQAIALTEIAFAAKRDWGYPEQWIQRWAPLLTITPEFIKAADVGAARLGEDIAGFHALSYHGVRASLEHLWVLPAYMGRGIGRALFSAVLERCRAHGCIALEIEADPNAAGFYEKVGARAAGARTSEVADQTRVLPLLEIQV